MLDRRLFTDDADATWARLGSRGTSLGITTISRAEGRGTGALTEAIQTRRQTIHHVEQLRQALNHASARMATAVAQGQGDAVAQARGGLKALKDDIKVAEERMANAEALLDATMLTLPNLPAPNVPFGVGEADNTIVAVHGERPTFTFAPKSHWELAQNLGIVDFTQGSRISGPRFAVLRGAGARLERALATLMLDAARAAGHLEISPPLLVRQHAMQHSGQYPKFVGEAFETQDREHALIPTAEVPLVSMHADSIFEAAALPLRYVAYTPCFRREAGAAGKDTRGLIRMHQFNKVELVSFVAPEASEVELVRIRQQATAVLDVLGLPYRTVALCTADLGFAAAETFDVEVWLPGQSAYREISSCSNCTDFQARRASIRYRPPPSSNDKTRPKPTLLHTLNGSALAVGRTLVAVLENYQQADGTIRVPEALVPYFGATRVDRADS